MENRDPAWKRIALVIEAALFLLLTVAAITERPIRWLIGLL